MSQPTIIPVPTRHQLDAALLVASVLSHRERKVDELQAVYTHLPSEGVYDANDLRAAEKLLVVAGLAVKSRDTIRLNSDPTYLRGVDRSLARQLLLAEVLAVASPPWLVAATATGELRSAYLPTEVERVLGTTIPDPLAREALLLSLGQKHGVIALREQIGLIGEETVVAACRETLASIDKNLATRVQHVSLISDALGYDVSTPTVDGEPIRLEVKTIGLTQSVLRVYLTRHEFDVGSRDDGWRLVICHMTSSDSAAIIGWCRGSDLVGLAPADSHSGRWTEARIDLRRESLQSGLPLFDGGE